MTKLRTVLFVVFLSVSLGSNGLEARSGSTPLAPFSGRKAAAVNRVLASMQKLSIIARSNKSASNLDRYTLTKLRNVVARLKKVDELVTLALMCRAVVLISSEVASLPYDRVFDEGFWHCVTVLSRQTSDDAIEALETLKQYANTDAGHTRLMEEAIEEQKAKRMREDTR